MKVYDLILKKRNGGELSKDEIEFLVSGYVNGSIPDYQMAAMAMAVYFQGMTEEETFHLTMTMINSGETIKLDEIPGVKVDKHSTGGVGDTTTLVLVPLVAAAGMPVAKLSGRGLGHTGGTLDKLESIPGFKTDMAPHELVSAVKKVGVAVAGQTGKLVPADKMLYALRDVTATVDSLPLIAASIMSKKLAAGADALVLDVKTGDGAFIKERSRAVELAGLMVRIGNRAGRRTVAVITAMDQPLGRAVGNALEVEEAVKTLQGKGPPDLEELCLSLGGTMLALAGAVGDPEEGGEVLSGLIAGGAALDKFKEMIANQGGAPGVADDLSLLPHAAVQKAVKAARGGYVARLRAQAVGEAAMVLGAGREKKDAPIDPAAGITLEKKVGDLVEAGETLAYLHLREDTERDAVEAVIKKVFSAYELQDSKEEKAPLVYECIKF